MFHGLVAEAEGSEVHRDQPLCAEFLKGLDGLFGIHVDIAFARGVVGSDRQEGEFDVEPFADFLEAGEVSRIATMEDRPAFVLEEKSAEPAVLVMEDAGTPVEGRGHGDLEPVEVDALPLAHFMDPLEAESMDEISDIVGDGDRLVGGHHAKGLAVEVVEMGMGHEHEIDGREVADFEAWLFDAFDDLEPLRPVRVDQDAVFRGLDEERGMSDPGDAKLIVDEFWEDGLERFAGAFCEHRRDQDFGQEVALVPSLARLHSDVIAWTGFLLSFGPIGKCAFYDAINHPIGDYCRMIQEEKQRLRDEILARIRGMPDGERELASEKICAGLEDVEAWGRAERVGLFAPMLSEPDVLRLLGAGKRCYLPAVVGTELRWRAASRDAELVPGAFGIRVPGEKAPRGKPREFDVILVPGVAFGRSGARLGRGGGFYDRFLEEHPAVYRVGICFEDQFVGELPTEPHDAHVDCLVTEAEIRYFMRDAQDV